VGRAIVALTGPAAEQLARPFTRIAGHLRALLRQMFGDYHPERHYMRGPGPACRAKQRH
jgi:hypothetical protein